MYRHSFRLSILVVSGLLVLSAPHIATARTMHASRPPRPQCSSGPCRGSCAICPPCTPGTICPERPCRLGSCETASGMCQCVAVQAPTPTPMPQTPTPTASPSPCLDTALCIQGFHWSPTQCQCVPDNATPTPCVDTVLCIRGSHWSPTQCQCVPDNATPTPCVDTVLCIRGFHWSPQRCACVPDKPQGPHSPQSPHVPHQPHAPR